MQVGADAPGEGENDPSEIEQVRCRRSIQPSWVALDPHDLWHLTVSERPRIVRTCVWIAGVFGDHKIKSRRQNLMIQKSHVIFLGG